MIVSSRSATKRCKRATWRRRSVSPPRRRRAEDRMEVGGIVTAPGAAGAAAARTGRRGRGGRSGRDGDAGQARLQLAAHGTAAAAVRPAEPVLGVVDAPGRDVVLLGD